jgi:tripartite-type tricarboxylate transporter receptor subunit TctC
MNRRRTLAAFVAALLCSTPGLSWAQLPKTLKVVVAFPPGGAVDVAARLYTEALRKATGATIIVENKTGAGGRLGTQFVKEAAPDGATLLFSPSSILTVYPHVYKSLPFDSLKDFAPIAPACEYVFGLGVGPATPAKTMPEFLEWARQNRDKASYGSPGAGTSPHFIRVMLSRAANAPLTHVPYRGGANALQDVVAGHLAAMVTTLPNLIQPHKTGRLRILAHSGQARLKDLPDVPTFKELGYAKLDVQESFGFFAPAGTPTPLLDALSSAIAAAGRSPEVQEGLAKLGFEPAAVADRAKFSAMIQQELKQWGEIVKSVGFTPEE